MGETDEVRQVEGDAGNEGADGRKTRRPAGRRRLFASLGSVVGSITNVISGRRLLAIVAIAAVAAVMTLTGTLVPGSGNEDGLTAQTDDMMPTNKWANFYSLQSTLDGEPVPVGTVITAHDPHGVVCGKFVVTEAGCYGLMPVYSDALLTRTDEGAVPGDRLEFRVNGIQASALGPDEPVWTAMGDLKQVNLAASSLD